MIAILPFRMKSTVGLSLLVAISLASVAEAAGNTSQLGWRQAVRMSPGNTGRAIEVSPVAGLSVTTISQTDEAGTHVALETAEAASAAGVVDTQGQHGAATVPLQRPKSRSVRGMHLSAQHRIGAGRTCGTPHPDVATMNTVQARILPGVEARLLPDSGSGGSHGGASWGDTARRIGTIIVGVHFHVIRQGEFSLACLGASSVETTYYSRARHTFCFYSICSTLICAEAAFHLLITTSKHKIACDVTV